MLSFLGLHSLLQISFDASGRSHTYSPAQELPKEPAQTQHQLPDETVNRGGEASTSSPNQSPMEPIGNEHTAKWKVYTTTARRLAEQVKSVTPALT